MTQEQSESKAHPYPKRGPNKEAGKPRAAGGGRKKTLADDEVRNIPVAAVLNKKQHEFVIAEAERRGLMGRRQQGKEPEPSASLYLIHLVEEAMKQNV